MPRITTDVVIHGIIPFLENFQDILNIYRIHRMTEKISVSFLSVRLWPISTVFFKIIKEVKERLIIGRNACDVLSRIKHFTKICRNLKCLKITDENFDEFYMIRLENLEELEFAGHATNFNSRFFENRIKFKKLRKIRCELLSNDDEIESILTDLEGNALESICFPNGYMGGEYISKFSKTLSELELSFLTSNVDPPPNLKILRSKHILNHYLFDVKTRILETHTTIGSFIKYDEIHLMNLKRWSDFHNIRSIRNLLRAGKRVFMADEKRTEITEDLLSKIKEYLAFHGGLLSSVKNLANEKKNIMTL